MPSPTHHRAIALVLTVLLSLGLTHRARRLDVPPSATPAARHRQPAVVDPNTADVAALETLPGIGPVLAQRIAAARASGARFARVEDLAQVRGLGPAHIARIAPRLRFARDPPSSADPPRP